MQAQDQKHSLKRFSKLPHGALFILTWPGYCFSMQTFFCRQKYRLAELSQICLSNYYWVRELTVALGETCNL